MKINELRIGNYTFHGKSICKVTSIFISHFRCTDENGIDHGNSIQESYHPIPLTEEWLLKFGFENIGGYLWNCRELGENRFINNPYGITHFEIKGHYEKKHIQYVHQLQNLYLDLTGNELTEDDIFK